MNNLQHVYKQYHAHQCYLQVINHRSLYHLIAFTPTLIQSDSNLPIHLALHLSQATYTNGGRDEYIIKLTCIYDIVRHEVTYLGHYQQLLVQLD